MNKNQLSIDPRSLNIFNQSQKQLAGPSREGTRERLQSSQKSLYGSSRQGTRERPPALSETTQEAAPASKPRLSRPSGFLAVFEQLVPAKAKAATERNATRVAEDVLESGTLDRAGEHTLDRAGELPPSRELPPPGSSGLPAAQGLPPPQVSNVDTHAKEALMEEVDWVMAARPAEVAE